MHTMHTRVQCQIDYRATLNSKQDLSTPSMLLWVRLAGVDNLPTQTAGGTGDRLDGFRYGYIGVLIEYLSTFNTTLGRTCGSKQAPRLRLLAALDNWGGGSYGCIRVLIE